MIPALSLLGACRYRAWVWYRRQCSWSCDGSREHSSSVVTTWSVLARSLGLVKLAALFGSQWQLVAGKVASALTLLHHWSHAVVLGSSILILLIRFSPLPPSHPHSSLDAWIRSGVLPTKGQPFLATVASVLVLSGSNQLWAKPAMNRHEI